MILTENDKINLSNLYEAIKSNDNRFAGINPEHAKIIKAAEYKLEQSYQLVDQIDPFYYSTLIKMLPDNRNTMVRPDIKTMQTDGKHLYYNPMFVNNLPINAVFTIVVHEIMHITFGHHILFAHIDAKNRNLWHLVNIACDLAINHLLQKREGFIEGGLILAGEGDYADLPKGLNAKQYFDLLVKKYSGEDPNKQETPQQPPEPQQGQEDTQDQGEDEGSDEGAGEGQEGSEDDSGEGEEGSEGEDAGEQTGEPTGTGKGSGKGKGKPSPDGTGEESEESEESGEGDIPSFKDYANRAKETMDKNKQKGKAAGKPATTSQEDIENQLQIPQEVIDDYLKTGEIERAEKVDINNQQNAMAEHEKQIEEGKNDAETAERAAASRGVSYGEARSRAGVGDWKKSLTKETGLNWKNILREFINIPSPERPTYSKPPPRFMDEYSRQGIIPSGMTGHTIKEVCFLVDVSGSMPDSVVSKVLGEVADIGTELNGKCTVRLVTFSTRIGSEKIFTSSNETFESVKGYEMGKRERVPSSQVMKYNKMKTEFANFAFDKTGGGTDITSAIMAVKKLRKKPSLVIVFTDGDFSGRENENLPELAQGLKLIWLLTTEDTSHKQGNAYFRLDKYNMFASTGKVYNLNDYTRYGLND